MLKRPPHCSCWLAAVFAGVTWVSAASAQPAAVEPAPAEPAPAEPAAPASPAQKQAEQKQAEQKQAEQKQAEPASTPAAPTARDGQPATPPAPGKAEPASAAAPAAPPTKTQAGPKSAPPAEPAGPKSAPLKPVAQPTTAAAASSDDSVYALDARVDIPLFLIPGLLSTGWLLIDSPAECAPLCDPATVNKFDRSSAGNFDENWRLASDLTLFGTLGGGIAVLLGDGGFVGGLKDFVVVAESIIWANGLAAIGNLAVRRPRPLLYSADTPLESRNNPAASLSFISGHSALVAAVTTSVFSTTYRRNPDSALPWVVLGVGTASTAMASAGRVLAGRHFPSDVLLGTALGASTGFLLPAIHDSPIRLTPVVSKNEGRIIGTASW